MPKKNFNTLPKKMPSVQPNKALGKGVFGPIVAPHPRSDMPFGSIMGAKMKLPKEPKISRKPGKPIKLAPPSYL